MIGWLFRGVVHASKWTWTHLRGAPPPHLTKRSSQWPRVRRQFLKDYPRCAACGARKRLNVHHVVPFHINPALELVPDNLITLCEGGGNCHLIHGHLKDWKAYNPEVRRDAAYYLAKVTARRYAA
jgi:5-methylcytosine-specific restriction protein A